MCVAEVDDSVPPIRILRARFGRLSAREDAIPDSEVELVLRVMCKYGGSLQPPPDLANQTLDLLERGGSVREAGQRLLEQLEANDPRRQFFATLLQT